MQDGLGRRQTACPNQQNASEWPCTSGMHVMHSSNNGIGCLKSALCTLKNLLIRSHSYAVRSAISAEVGNCHDDVLICPYSGGWTSFKLWSISTAAPDERCAFPVTGYEKIFSRNLLLKTWSCLHVAGRVKSQMMSFSGGASRSHSNEENLGLAPP